MDEALMRQEVAEQFGYLVAALNSLDTAAWAEHYSRDGFVSAIVGTEYCATRAAWIELIAGYFAQRESQHVEPRAVRVAVLGPTIALLTSEELGLMRLRSCDEIRSQHVFTMVWQREAAGWKIVHSHESWVDA